MEKNTIIAIVLCSLIIVGSMVVQMTFFPPQETVPAQNDTSEIINADAVPVESEVHEVLEIPENLAVNNEEIEEEKVTINTGKALITLTNRGGDMISYELLDHKDGNKGVEMVDNISEYNRAFALSFGTENNRIINDLFNVKKIDNYTVRFTRSFSLKGTNSTDNFNLIKQYTFMPDDYLFKLDVFVEGKDGMQGLVINNAAYTLRSSPQIGPHFDKKKDRYETRNFMSYTEDKKKKQNLGDNQIKTYDNTFTWTGVSGKYFTALISPVNEATMDKAVYSTLVEKDAYTNAQVMLTRVPILQSSVKDTYFIYMGPLSDSILKTYNNSADNKWNLSNLHLDYSMSSSGILSWLEIFLKWCLELLNKLVHNWGISIIIMTILLKVALFPLTKKSSVSSLKMQQMQPQIKELQDKYKDNPEKLNVEMAKLYKEAGSNPLSGCLPLIIQFPLLIAMFNLFNNYFEFRGAMFIPGWIPDLSVGDSVYTLGFNIPFIGNQIRILPFIYVASQLISGKITNTANAAAGSSAMQMKLMTYGMPIMFFFVLYNTPSGLNLYWTISNILAIGQQLIINKVMKAKRAEIEAENSTHSTFVAKKKKR